MKPNHLSKSDLARLLVTSILWVRGDPRPKCLRVAAEHARAYDSARWAYESLAKRLKEPAAKLGSAQRWDDPNTWGEKTRAEAQSAACAAGKAKEWQAWVEKHFSSVSREGV